jgi:hypothetical protein
LCGFERTGFDFTGNNRYLEIDIAIIMNKTEKCVIDNWSLEHAAILLDVNSDITAQKEISYENNLGGLSNFIQSLLLYKDRYFILNGFEKDWRKFSWFDSRIKSTIKGIALDEMGIDWESSASYADKGIRNYLSTSEYFESDLIVAPERADSILSLDLRSIMGRPFLELLREIDGKIIQEKDRVIFTDLKVGIQNNFIIPSLTQYVLSEATNRDDLLQVILQLRESKKIENIARKISEISSSVKESSKLQREVDSIIKKEFGNQPNGNEWSIGVSAMFLSIGKNLDLSFFDRREHIVFLKNLIKCRAEAHRLKKDFERIFKKKLIQ